MAKREIEPQSMSDLAFLQEIIKKASIKEDSVGAEQFATGAKKTESVHKTAQSPQEEIAYLKKQLRERDEQIESLKKDSQAKDQQISSYQATQELQRRK